MLLSNVFVSSSPSGDASIIGVIVRQFLHVVFMSVVFELSLSFSIASPHNTADYWTCTDTYL